MTNISNRFLETAAIRLKRKLCFLCTPFLFLLIACTTQLTASENKNWPEDLATQFLLPLTFPDAEWLSDDFGEQSSTSEQHLLNKYRPKIYIAPGSLVPIDFYESYLPNSVVKNANDAIINPSPDRDYLKSIERRYGHYLDYQGIHPYRDSVDLSKYKSAMYGRVYEQQMEPPISAKGSKSKNYLVLKYNAAFTASGLPAKQAWYKNLGVMIAGDIRIWHELDIHGAIHILINEKTMKPEILLLAQHNHFRSYVFGEDLPWPKNNRLKICYAIYSNEPYPCPEETEPVPYRTVGNPANFAYVINGKSMFLDGSEDLVYGENAGALEVQYKLKFLPSKDPLYVSWIPLGDKLKILGVFSSFYREGPPGIDMNTIPELIKYTDMAKFWYFKEGDTKAVQIIKQSVKGFDNIDIQPLLQYHGSRLWQQLKDKQ